MPARTLELGLYPGGPGPRRPSSGRFAGGVGAGGPGALKLDRGSDVDSARTPSQSDRAASASASHVDSYCRPRAGPAASVGPGLGSRAPAGRPAAEPDPSRARAMVPGPAGAGAACGPPASHGCRGPGRRSRSRPPGSGRAARRARPPPGPAGELQVDC